MQNNQVCKKCNRTHADIFEQTECQADHTAPLAGMSTNGNLEQELKDRVAAIRARAESKTAQAGTASPSFSSFDYIPVKERKVRDAIREQRIERLMIPGLFMVRSERTDMQYLVSLNEPQECSCPGFAFTGHCYHLEAVQRIGF